MDTRTAAYTIGQIEPSELPEEQLLEGARLERMLAAERVPEDPPAPLEVYVRRARLVRPNEWHAVFAARDARGELVGIADAGQDLEQPHNAHLFWTQLSVHAAHRRRGLGRDLLRRVAEAVRPRHAAPVLLLWTIDRIPAAKAFLEAVGATPGLSNKSNQLDLREVDQTRVKGWASRAPAGYRLAMIDDRVPEAQVAAYIEAGSGMNDAPRGDLPMGDWTMTEAQIRQNEEWRRKAGVRWWLALAVHEATGAGAGFSSISYDTEIPHLVRQQGTATISAHRGHGIGLWMKAAMLDRIVRELPEARHVRTGNANVNAPMLAINTQLGFKYAWSETIWHLRV